MSEPTCPKCNAAQEDGVSRVFVCGSILSFVGVHQSDRCKLAVAERERDEARAIIAARYQQDEHQKQLAATILEQWGKPTVETPRLPIINED